MFKFLFATKLFIIFIFDKKKNQYIIIVMFQQKNKKDSRSTEKIGLKNKIVHNSSSQNKENAKKSFKVQTMVCKDYQYHPAGKYIGETKVDHTAFTKFSTLLYRGLYYSVCNLKGPSEEYLKKKSVTLPQPQLKYDKILLLDLDETLIHSIFNNDPADVHLNQKQGQFKFNIRPYCLEFLQKMSKYFGIYVFTASTQDYAQPIVNHLNKTNKTIHSVLHRKNCMETHNGFYIKDLRIIKNRPLSKIILVDNLVHSFGLQIQNGIPILEFTNNTQDKQLHRLQRFLMQIKDVEDVRKHIKAKINLRKCLQFQQAEFLFVDKPKNENI